MSSSIVKTTEELVRPILDKNNFELVDIEYVKEGPDWFLRVYIDKEGGINIDECGQVSTELSDKLDDVDMIKENYFLEVSSPGVERPLKSKADFEKYIGKHVYVSLYAPIEDEKEFTGTLLSFTNDIVTVEYKEKTRKKQVDIPFDKIANARLAVML